MLVENADGGLTLRKFNLGSLQVMDLLWYKVLQFEKAATSCTIDEATGEVLTFSFQRDTATHTTHKFEKCQGGITRLKKEEVEKYLKEVRPENYRDCPSYSEGEYLDYLGNKLFKTNPIH